MKNLLKQSSLTSKLTWLVFGLAVVFADVMYLQLVWSVVHGVLALLALGGAFALGASVIMLPLKLKNGDIADGDQRTVAITVLVVEFALMILNTIVAFAESAGDVTDQFLSIYATYVAPATPILVAAGFLLIWLFDPVDLAERAKREARTAETIARIGIETEIRQSTLEGVQRNLQNPHFKRMVDGEIQRQTMTILRETFGVMRLDAPPEPFTIDVTPSDDAVTPTPPARDTKPFVGIDYAVPGSDQTTRTLHASPPPSPSRPAPTPYPVIRQAPTAPQKPAYTLQSLLKRLGVATVAEARATLERYGLRDAGTAYMQLRQYGKLPADLDQSTFNRLYAELVTPTPSDNDDDAEAQWETLYLNNGNGHHPNR